MTVAAPKIGQARAVKDELGRQLASVGEVNGIGLVRHDGGWAVKVNLVQSVADAAIPETMDGVRVFTDVIGEINAQ